jgi:MarR family transcriptional regulator, lower aerobic nicotinate degradation pathway regulator
MGSQASGRAPEGDVRVVMDHLRRIVRALRVSARAAERDTGLSGAQVFVLQKLAEEKATSIGDLAARTATDQSSVSVVVSRLADRGLVERGASDADARRVEIRLSRRGRAVLRRSPEVMQRELIDALGRMPEASRRALGRALGELVSSMDIGGPPEMFFEEGRKTSEED